MIENVTGWDYYENGIDYNCYKNQFQNRALISPTLSSFYILLICFEKEFHSVGQDIVEVIFMSVSLKCVSLLPHSLQCRMIIGLCFHIWLPHELPNDPQCLKQGIDNGKGWKCICWTETVKYRDKQKKTFSMYPFGWVSSSVELTSRAPES